MIKTVTYTSENGNAYIYDHYSRISMLVHPQLKNVSDGHLLDIDPYYVRKYNYLKKYGFFSESKDIDFIPLDKSIVENNISDIQQIVFETTDSCNLNCVYCALGDLYEGADKKINKKMNIHHAITLLKYIFDFIPANSKKKIYISFYGGEALLNINFIKQIVNVVGELNSEKQIEIQYSMTTNATLIHKYIDFLIANDFSILVSLDGNEWNHSYRVFKSNGENSFSTVIKNIDWIKEKFPQYFYKRIRFNAVLHDRNSVKDITEFIYNRYNIIPRIAELNMRDIRKEQRDKIESMYHNKRKSEREYQTENAILAEMTHDRSLLYRELTNFLKFYTINYYISNIIASLHTGEKFLPTCTCSPFSKKIFLTVHNKLLPCEKINYKYSMGSVQKNVNIDISQIVQFYNSFYKKMSKFCKKCYAYRFCGTCFFQLNDIEQIDDNNFSCANFCDQQKFKKKISNLFSFMEKNPTDFSNILENIIIA